MKEEWKDIPGYEGRYQASSFGRIRSVRFRRSPFMRILRQSFSNGYLVLSLPYNGGIKTWRAHRIIALTFIKNTSNKPMINHINGNKLDNRVENLEWSTRSENEIHKHKILGQPGTMKGRFGCNNPKSKKVNQYTLLGKFIKTWDCGYSAQRELGFDNRNIFACCKGNKKSAYGFLWKFKTECYVSKSA